MARDYRFSLPCGHVLYLHGDVRLMFSVMVYFRDKNAETVEYRVPTYSAWKCDGHCLYVNICDNNNTPTGIEVIPMDLIARVVVVEVEE